MQQTLRTDQDVATTASVMVDMHSGKSERGDGTTSLPSNAFSVEGTKRIVTSGIPGSLPEPLLF